MHETLQTPALAVLALPLGRLAAWLRPSPRAVRTSQPSAPAPMARSGLAYGWRNTMPQYAAVAGAQRAAHWG